MQPVRHTKHRKDLEGPARQANLDNSSLHNQDDGLDEGKLSF